MSAQPLALVTGAAHRLGKAFALALARNGYAVFLHYHKSELRVSETTAEIRNLNVPVFSSSADLTDLKEIISLFALIDKIAHPLRVLVNSAAIMPVGDPHTLTDRDWDSALNLNLRAPFLCSQEAVKRMTEGGLIINVSDVGAQKTWSRYPSYAVSKAGLETLTKILARSFAPLVRVNAIAPGLVLRSDLISSEEWERLVGRIPLKRSATVEEIASALEFLLLNEYVTGQTIVIDGGYSLLG
jgi:NAD(P)-dependent dehydrogenase (short-subunit alcohol dehydrogenase family)